MNCCYGNNICTVLRIEVFKVRQVLEVVRIDVAAVYNIVWLNIISEFNNL